MAWLFFNKSDKKEVRVFGTDLVFGCVYESSQNQLVTPVKAISDYKIGLDGFKCDYVIMIISGVDSGRCYNPSKDGIDYKIVANNLEIKI